MTHGTVTIQHVVRTCRDRAGEFRDQARRFKTSGNRDLELEYEGMALAADRLADEFEKSQSAAHILRDGEIDQRARLSSPDAFKQFDAMLARLRSEGVDDGQALRSAQLSYGSLIDKAREEARRALEAEATEPDVSDEEYGRGVNDAILWHETRAREADILENNEQDSHRKAKLRQRADRHRLYARHMRAHFEEQRAQEQARQAQTRRIESAQQALPLSAIPLEVQMLFLKRTDNVAGEAFD